MTQEMLDWIEAHKADDPLRLRLKYSGDAAKEAAILQIECRRKTASKLRETLGNPLFEFPTALSAEQCTSDMLARYHAGLIESGAKVLDMTMGLGIDAFHIARCASSVDGIERDPVVAWTAVHNAQVLGLDNVTVTVGDSEEIVRKLPADSYDTVFVDPARRGAEGQRLFALSDCSPDVAGMLPRLLEIAPVVIVKASPMLDVTQTLRELPGTSDIYVTGTTTECKELVAVVRRGFEGESKIHCVTLSATSEADFVCRAGNDYPTPLYGDPHGGEILYEPWPAVMKGGVMAALSEAFPALAKLQGNTHLFVSKEECSDFPGDLFRIAEVYPFASSTIKAFARRRMEADLTVRNFPLSQQELARRIKLVPRGPRRVFAVTSVSGPMLIVCEPLKRG